MIELSRHIKIDKKSKNPIYIQIAETLANMIRSGLLPPDIRIQTTRGLSQKMGVHRKTVVAAYNELLAQGWLQSKPRKGIFVSPILPIVTPIPIAPGRTPHSYATSTNFDVEFELEESLIRKSTQQPYTFVFNDGFPDVRLAPLAALLREYQSLGKLKVSRKLLTYSAREGSLNLRMALANDLRQTRGMPVTADNILLTKGAQMGIFLTASLLIKPGDIVIVGEPNYFVVNLLFKRLGAQVVGVPVDEHGMNIERLEDICKKRKVRMVYIIPHHHHPTTVTLSPERRLKLLTLAEKHRIAVIEDDYDFDIHYEGEPVLPMASIDRTGSIIYVGTLSKIIAPGIRIGFVVGPKELITKLAQHRFLIEMQSDNLLEEAVAVLFNNGTVGRHLKKIRRIYRERRDVACKILRSKMGEHTSFKVPDGGMSIWVNFRGVGTKAIAAAAAKKGLFICDGTKHNTARKDFNSVCLGFASMNASELEQALGILSRSVTAARKN